MRKKAKPNDPGERKLEEKRGREREGNFGKGHGKGRERARLRSVCSAGKGQRGVFFTVFPPGQIVRNQIPKNQREGGVEAEGERIVS